MTNAVSGKLPTPEQVAELYKETLAAENLSCSGSSSGSISFDFWEDFLLTLSVKPDFMDDRKWAPTRHESEGNLDAAKRVERLKGQIRFPQPQPRAAVLQGTR